jgi:hypothetical protein
MTKPAPDWRPPAPKQKRPEYFQEKRQTLSQQQAELAQALTDFVIKRNGWVTSPPGLRKLRVELPASIAASVVDELSQMKFAVQHVGQGERLWFERQVPVEIFEISIR